MKRTKKDTLSLILSHHNQVRISDALKLIDSDDCVEFDIHYRYLLGDDAEMSIEKYIEQADNHGSFWLRVSDGTDKVYQHLQIVDDKTLEPIWHCSKINSIFVQNKNKWKLIFHSKINIK